VKTTVLDEIGVISLIIAISGFIAGIVMGVLAMNGNSCRNTEELVAAKELLGQYKWHNI